MSRDAISTLTGNSTDGAQTHVTGTQVGMKRALDVNMLSQGIGSPLENVAWVSFSVAQTSATVETYTFYSDVAKTVLVATLVLTFVDATRALLLGGVWTTP